MKRHLLLLLSLLPAFCLPLIADNWMMRLPDDAYVSTLSIPGSHDSGTGNGFPGISTSIYGPFGDKYARTQEKSFEEQWDMGVRAFDLRPAIKDDYINVNHGIMPTNLRFDTAIYMLRDKLRENPSEFAIIHLLHASDGDNNSSAYGERLLELFGRDDLKDYLVDFKPTLTVKEMRGKILFLSRNEYADKPVGGFFRNWTGQVDWNNQIRGQIVGAAGTTAKLYMQDYAETHTEGALDLKVGAIRQMLDFSTKHVTRTASNIVWVYNFASAYSKVSRLYIPFVVDEQLSTSDGYRDNASYTNAAIIDYLADPSHTAGPTGIILADYVGVDWSGDYHTRGKELVDALIANNFRYLKDMTQVHEGDATHRTPIDMTARIVNPGFNCNLTEPGWQGDPFGADNPKENAEHFNRNFDTHQTITGLPNGVYAVGVKAFYRCGLADEAYAHYRIRDRATRAARLYAKAGQDTLANPLVSPFSKSVVRAKNVGREVAAKQGSLSYYIPDDLISAEYYMHSLSAYNNKVFVGTNNHALTIGVKKDRSAGMDWCAFDDFTLTYYGNQAEAYQLWITEMRKVRVTYTTVTVTKSYSDRYDEVYNVTVSNLAQAVLAMKVINTAAEAIAINAELWAEYKQAASVAEELLEGNDIGEDAKEFLRTYCQSVYQQNLSDLLLTNEELPRAIDELYDYIELTRSGQWTGIATTPASTDVLPADAFFTLDGKSVARPLHHGLYIQRCADGSVRKILR